jgi:hypothetical protein
MSHNEHLVVNHCVNGPLCDPVFPQAGLFRWAVDT